MPNPVIVPCPVGVWTKVATNVTVTGGSLWRRSTKPHSYFFTYKLTGQAKPDDSAVIGVPIFVDEDPGNERIDASGIDLYIRPVGGAGSVEVHV